MFALGFFKGRAESSPLLSFLLLAGLVSLLPASWAEEAKITVREILAHKENNEIDPALSEKILDRLWKTFRYKGYKLIWDHHARLTAGESRYLQLSEGHSLFLQPFLEEKILKLKITIFHGDKKVIGPITIIPEKSPTLVGPRKLKTGDMLLYISTYE